MPKVAELQLLDEAGFLRATLDVQTQDVRAVLQVRQHLLLVIVDDVALACGLIRLRPDGGAGGHNGLADIEQKLGTEQYPRLRVGIDAPGEIPQRNYVLGRFRPDQQELVEPALETAVDGAVCWVLHGIDEAMNRFNRRNTG